MFKSYYYLNRLSLELNNLLPGKKIINIFSQEKDRLIIHLKDGEDLFLEISVNHSEPYLNIKERFSRSKKNTIDFYNELINSTIIKVEIANDDRIIRIVTSNGDILFAIRGKYTNLYYTLNNQIQPFKSQDDEISNNFLVEISQKEFINHFNTLDYNLISGKSISEIRNIYRFVGREIENEIIARKKSNQTDTDLLLEVLKDIELAKPAVYFDDALNEVHIGFNRLKILSNFQYELYANILQAFNQYLIKKYKLSDKQIRLKRITSYLDKELKKLTSKLNNLLPVIENGPRDEEYNKFANLILINLYNIKSGLTEIELEDIYDSQIPGKMIKIKLDDKLSPQKNADRFFEKAKDSKIHYGKSIKIYRNSTIEFEKLKSIQNELQKEINEERIGEIMKELKIKPDESRIINDNTEIKFKHYLVDGKYHVFVGKDSQNNDLLTTRFAKQNDFWFHARSVSGSHVVLRVENIKEAIPKSILKKAASLAAYHSKAKTAGLVPVSYTYKKYVIKRKGMPIGQVSLLKEETLIVKPEIPSGCDYLSD